MLWLVYFSCFCWVFGVGFLFVCLLLFVLGVFKAYLCIYLFEFGEVFMCLCVACVEDFLMIGVKE